MFLSAMAWLVLTWTPTVGWLLTVWIVFETSILRNISNGMLCTRYQALYVYL